MATFAYLNAYFSFNSVDLSAYVRSVTLKIDGEALSAETMGDTWTEKLMGLKSWSVDVELLDDFAASTVDQTIWNAFNAGNPVTVAIKPVNAATSSSNPQYSGSVLPNAHTVGGQHGQMASKSLSFVGTGALTRATS